MIIVMLNLLITVVSEVFEQTIGETIIKSYANKAEINLNYSMIMNLLRPANMNIAYMVFTIPKQELDDEDENWMGFVHQIKKNTNLKIELN